MKPFPQDVKLMSIEGTFRAVAEDFIPSGTKIGPAYLKLGERVHHLVLGGFLAPSYKPNCMLITTDQVWYLWSIQDIFVHHPLTIDYNLYLL